MSRANPACLSVDVRGFLAGFAEMIACLGRDDGVQGGESYLVGMLRSLG